MALKRLVVLIGGVGGAKLGLGLTRIVPPESLTFIVNTGDDMTYYGLRISPDIDTLLYTLSGRVDPVNGWGVAGDTRQMLETLRSYGETPWFGLGDKDIATHLIRTTMLNQGARLTEVIAYLAKGMGVLPRVLPMSDNPIPTMIETEEEGTLAFQEYFVKHRWQPTVKAIHHQGAEHAALSPEVAQAIAEADAIIVAPSNPWLSIAPILAVPGMREALLARDVPRVAVTPIVNGTAIKGPTAKIMAELGLDVTAETVAAYYGPLLTGFISDVQDTLPDLKGLRTTSFDTMMSNDTRKIELAREVLDWIGRRMTVWAVIPVKPLNRAKSRLEKVLSPEQRALLAEMLFRQVLSVVLSSNRIGGVLVISRDTRVIGMARDMGAKTIQESGQSDLNPALERATQVLQSWRASGVFILPADLPLVHVDDINAMIDSGREGEAVVIATDRAQDGTNALFVRPPGLLEYTYGKESFRKHVMLARAAGAKVTIYESERLQLDIDEPTDLDAYNQWVVTQADPTSHLRPFCL